MDRSKQSDASYASQPSTSTDDLDPYLEAMRLGEPSSSQRQQRPCDHDFVQRVILECGSEEFKQGVVERLMEDVVSLSHHQFGSYVVEACFLRARSLALLLRVLSAFLGLRDDQLAELVQCGFGNYVVHKLLQSGKDHFPEQTLALARRIEKLPAAVPDYMHARQVMRVVKRLLPRQRPALLVGWNERTGWPARPRAVSTNRFGGDAVGAR